MTAFVAVADEGGFAAAARRLGLSQASVSRQVGALEAQLGSRLIARTTRRLALTDVGERYLARARQVLTDLADAELIVRDDAIAPTGLVRISAASSFARRHVAPRLAAFRARHPGIQIDLNLEDHYADLVTAGIDLAIRLGPPSGDGLVVRRLTDTRLVLCAAPSVRVDQLADPADLKLVDTLVLDVYAGRDRWPFARGTEERLIEVTPVLRINDAAALRLAALSGAGVTVLPDYLVGGDLDAGTLVELLPDWRLPELPVMLVMPARRHTSRRVRLMVDFLIETLGGPAHPD